MEESNLISKTEKYLNEISHEKIDINKINDFDYYKNLYSSLDTRLDKLQKLKDSMDSKGYKRPYRSLTKYGTGNAGEVSFEEKTDNSHHNQQIRIKANAKKNILGRVISAVNSHKIAIGNLIKYANVKCESCYKKYEIDEYFDKGEKCDCGSTHFSFKINKDKSHRIEILPYLPLSGNYMVLMSGFSKWGRIAYKNVLNLLKQERKGVVKTISLVIKFKDENNRLIRKTINLGSEYLEDYEEEVRNRYGKNVRIEVLRFHRTKPAIIDDKYTRSALAIAYVKYGEKLANDIKESLFKKNISDFKRLNKYDEIILKYRHETPKFIEKEDLDGLEQWRESKITAEFKENGFVDKYGKINRHLNRDLKIRKNIEKNIFTNIPAALIKWDIFKYYLTTSFNNRKTSISPFPNIRVDLDRQQRKAFQTTYNKAINTLNKEIDMKIIPIQNMDYILYEKFKFENLSMGSNIKFYFPALGVALVNLNSDIDIKTLGNIFNINESKIKKEIENIEKVKKPKSEKSKKFLELIKK